MKRRTFITLLGGTAAAWPLATRAQQSGRTRQITVWMGRGNDSEGLRNSSAFRQELQALGWADGRTVRTDYRWVTGDIDRARLAKEVVEQQPDVIVIETTPGVAALSRESRTIPMVFVNVSDPIGSGFVANLARPNITGFMSNEPTLGGKWPELLKEIAPAVARVGFLFNPDTASYAEAFLRQAENAARSLGMELTAAHARNEVEIDHAIATLGSSPGGGLIVLPETTTNTRSQFIIAMAARYRLPAIYAYPYQATGGGLISYGVDLADLFRGAAETQLKAVNEAARTMGLQIQVLNADTSTEIDAAFETMGRERPDGVLVGTTAFLNGRRVQLAHQASFHRLPAIYASRDYAEAGGLMSYGSDIMGSWRQAGVYTGRILKGEKPADMPVVQPTQFELVINLSTARAIGIIVPPSLLAQANEVIE